MKKIPYLLFLLFLSVIPTSSVLSHPGHGNNGIDGYSLLHYLLAPTHLFLLVLISVVVYVIVKAIRKIRHRKSS